MPDRLNRITIDNLQCGGRPSIRGMRIRVSDVLELLSAGATFDDVLEDYPYLERKDISAAIQYAARQNGSPSSPVGVRFLTDNQLPPALARFMDTEPCCEARHVADVGLRDASDEEVWQYASANRFVLVSKDEDFTHKPGCGCSPASGPIEKRLHWRT
jgi:uncharacterized protein (DUF433 family)